MATTPIRWKVPKRRGLNARSRPVPAEGAIIELSIIGAAIVAPLMWRAVVGSKVEIEWNDMRGLIVVRREVPFPGSENLTMYGVEYADNSSLLAKELFDRLVIDASTAAVADAAAALVAERDTEANKTMAPPNAWSGGIEAR